MIQVRGRLGLSLDLTDLDYTTSQKVPEPAMLFYLTIIFGCQLVGESLVSWLQLPVPGPVIGMALLFLALNWKGSVPDDLSRVADGLLSNLSLLFIPAGVGVMLHFHLIETAFWPITIALVVSTLLTIALTGLFMTWLGKHPAKKQENNTEGKA